jgi:ABC-2 type transport system permease protein
MKTFSIALWAEILKVRKSKIFYATVLFFAFISVIMGLMMFLLQHPEILNRSEIMAAKASIIAKADWKNYLALQNQMILSIGTMGFGLVASWVFGREYSDRVIKDILALPVSRTNIVNAKIVVSLLWSLVLSITLYVVGILVGLIINIPDWSFDELKSGIVTFFSSAILNMLLITVVAFVASIGKGYILPLVFTIISLIMTQFVFMGVPEFAIYFPWGFPAIISGVAGDTVPQSNVVSYVIFFITVISGYLATIFWWKYADHK